MKIEQTILQKSFIVRHLDKSYFVDYINSDGQTLGLVNRDNWEIYDDDHESLQVYILKSMKNRDKIKAQKNIKLLRTRPWVDFL